MTMIPEKPDLLVPDRSIVSIEEAKQELQQKKEARGVGENYSLVSRKEMLTIITKMGDGIAEAAVAMGQKVYDQIADETTDLLEQMDANIRAQMMAEFERRSLRGRWRALVDRVRDYLIVRGVLSALPPADLHLVAEEERTAIVRDLAEP